MNEIQLKLSYDNYSGRLLIDPKIDKPRGIGHVREWLSENGLAADPSELPLPVRNQLSLEKRRMEGKREEILLNIQNMYGALRTIGLELQTYKQVLAPITMVPPEVLRRVLSFLAPDGSVSIEEALMALMQVCRLWKATIYDMPVMWENIKVPGSPEGQDWLARHLPKSKVNRMNIDWSWHSDDRSGLAEDLLSRCQHWRRLTFHQIRKRLYGPPNLSEALRKAESLREICWSGTYRSGWSNHGLPSHEPITLPSVRIFRLHRDIGLPRLILPNLTDLCLSDIKISRTQLRRFPDQFPNLHSISDEGSCVYPEEVLDERDVSAASPPKFQVLEVRHSLVGTSLTPLWLVAPIHATSLKTVLLTTEVIRDYRYHAGEDVEVTWMRHIRSLIIPVDSYFPGWWDIPLLPLFTGVENLQMQLEQSMTSQKSAVVILGKTPCTNKDHCALFPQLKRFSLSFSYSTKDDLSESVYQFLQFLAGAGSAWYCPTTLQVPDGTVFLDATVEEFGDLLGDLQNSWPSVRDAIHRTIPLC